MPKRKFYGSRRNTQVTLEPELAIAIIGITSSIADGDGLGHKEDYVLGEMLCSMAGFEEYSEQDYVELHNRAVEILQQEGIDEAFNLAIACLPNQDYKEAAYVTALVVIACDGDVPDEEAEFLANLQDALNISNKRAEEIFEEVYGEEEEEEETERQRKHKRRGKKGRR